MLAIPAITFFIVVLAVHIAAVVITFGVTFAYPMMAVYIRRAEPRSVPVLHRAWGARGRLLRPAGYPPGRAGPARRRRRGRRRAQIQRRVRVAQPPGCHRRH